MSNSPEIVEHVARALEADFADPAWDDLAETAREAWRESARAAIAAHIAALAAAGYVIVPREPTEAMIEASNREIDFRDNADWDGRKSHLSSGAWRAMIDAAPKLEVAE